MTRRRKPRQQVLLDQVRVGLDLKQAFSHPAVLIEIEAYREAIIKEMVLCEPNDDDGRRQCALQVQALDTIVQKILGKIGAGDRASQKLADMEENNG